jgi:hypothetical protein
MSELERIETLMDRLVLSSERGHNFCLRSGLQNCRFQRFVLPTHFASASPSTTESRVGGQLLG